MKTVLVTFILSATALAVPLVIPAHTGARYGHVDAQTARIRKNGELQEINLWHPRQAPLPPLPDTGLTSKEHMSFMDAYGYSEHFGDQKPKALNIEREVVPHDRTFVDLHGPMVDDNDHTTKREVVPHDVFVDLHGPMPDDSDHRPNTLTPNQVDDHISIKRGEELASHTSAAPSQSSISGPTASDNSQYDAILKGTEEMVAFLNSVKSPDAQPAQPPYHGNYDHGYLEAPGSRIDKAKPEQTSTTSTAAAKKTPFRIIMKPATSAVHHTPTPVMTPRLTIVEPGTTLYVY